MYTNSNIEVYEFGTKVYTKSTHFFKTLCIVHELPECTLRFFHLFTFVYFLYSISRKNVSLVFSLADCALKKQFSLAPRCFPPGTPVFPSPQKPTFSNSNSTRNQIDKEPLRGCATSKSLFIYLFIYLFNSRLGEKLDLGLVSAGWHGFEPLRPVFADKKVIICVLVCFNQFVVYSMRNPVVYWIAKK